MAKPPNTDAITIKYPRITSTYCLPKKFGRVGTKAVHSVEMRTARWHPEVSIAWHRMNAGIGREKPRCFGVRGYAVCRGRARLPALTAARGIAGTGDGAGAGFWPRNSAAALRVLPARDGT